MTTYRIKDWAKNFENNRTREMVKMAWVPVPNKHDGEGFQRIMQEPDGIVIYGCWHLILQVASKCLRERGTLLRDDGTPLDALSIALKTGWRKASDIQRALDFCSTPEMAWIERVTEDGAAIPQEGAAIPQEPARNGRELNGREGNENPSDSGKPTRTKRPVKLASDAEWLVSLREQYAKIGVDVEVQAIKAQAWLTGPKGRGRKFTRQFFLNWLSRVDCSMKPDQSASTHKNTPAMQDYLNGKL